VPVTYRCYMFGMFAWFCLYYPVPNCTHVGSYIYR